MFYHFHHLPPPGPGPAPAPPATITPNCNGMSNFLYEFYYDPAIPDTIFIQKPISGSPCRFVFITHELSTSQIKLTQEGIMHNGKIFVLDSMPNRPAVIAVPKTGYLSNKTRSHISWYIPQSSYQWKPTMPNPQSTFTNFFMTKSNTKFDLTYTGFKEVLLINILPTIINNGISISFTNTATIQFYLIFNNDMIFVKDNNDNVITIEYPNQQLLTPNIFNSFWFILFGGWIHFGYGHNPPQTFLNSSDPYIDTMIFSKFIHNDLTNIQKITLNPSKYENPNITFYHIGYVSNDISYLGCHGPIIETDPSTFSQFQKVTASIVYKPKDCRDICAAQSHRNFVVYAIESGAECYCGESYGQSPAMCIVNGQQECKCDTSCYQSTDPCGGDYLLSVYRINPSLSTGSSLSPIFDMNPVVMAIPISTNLIYTDNDFLAVTLDNNINANYKGYNGLNNAIPTD